ncbi:MAG: DUF4345 family protein [Pseudomonadales bacterium]
MPENELACHIITWYRALGRYWLSTGLMLLWIVLKIETQTAWFRFVHIGFMAVGVANLVTIMDTGTNTHSRYDAVIIELAVPLVFIAWQWSLRSPKLRNRSAV